MIRKPLCIIPARGGSKRFPMKNVATLEGKPLIAWSIGVAKESGLFDNVFVSSDSKKILNVAEEWGATPFRRSPEFAGDDSSLESVCKEVIENIKNQSYTDICLLLPTSPFRKSESLIKAWKIYVSSTADALMSIIPIPHPPQWAIHLENGHLVPYDEEGFCTERTNLKLLYRHDGAYFFSNKERFLETNTLMGSVTIPYYSDTIESVDIDEPLDIEWAKFLLRSEKAI